MTLKEYLLIPGPTPLPPRVLQAMNRPMIAHRGEEFVAIFNEVVEGLKWTFRTKNDLFVFPSSGTGGMEAAVANLFSAGDKVIVLNGGAFGGRFTKIARAYQLDVTEGKVARGEPATPQALAEAFDRAGDGVRGVLFQHNETSTGVLNDVRNLAQIARRHNALTVVDSISGMVAAPLETDAWDLDVVIAGAQKAFMIPPGLAFTSVGPRAWAAYEKAKSPRFYFDFGRYRDSAKAGQTPTTPAVSLFFGLQEALKMMKEEGLEKIQARHEQLMQATRAGIRTFGLTLFTDDSCASRAVTAILPPENISADEIRRKLRKEHGVILAGGQEELKGKIFRIGHLGYVDQADILAALLALEDVLTTLGYRVRRGEAVEAAKKVFVG